MIEQEKLVQHTNKYLSEGLGKPCPDCHGGSSMAGCGTCGGTGKVNDKSNMLTAGQRYDSLDSRTRRGTERYASVNKNSIRISLHGQAVEGKYETIEECIKEKGYKTEKDFKDAGFEWWEVKK